MLTHRLKGIMLNRIVRFRFGVSCSTRKSFKKEVGIEFNKMHTECLPCTIWNHARPCRCVVEEIILFCAISVQHIHRIYAVVSCVCSLHVFIAFLSSVLCTWQALSKC